ncbi:MAG: hydrogen gas-evolving membrane-bound hydrogenase subunit E [Peptococcaceae bacterium]
MKKLSLLLIVLMGSAFFYSVIGLPHIGDGNSAPNTHVSPRYIEKSYEETASPNMVTAVLADYRGYDTLGETTVIFIAGIATVMILRSAVNRKDERGEND